MTAHKRNGDRCGNPASHGGTVCGYHGGNAPAVKAKARLLLEMAADRMAKQLLGFADSAESEAAAKDALDRSGLAAKNAVSVEVGITKPWEAVFEGISQIIAGPRDPEKPTAPAIESEHRRRNESADEIIGEIDDDEIEDDLPRIQRERESAEIVDVEIVDAGYTDAPMSHSRAMSFDLRSWGHRCASRLTIWPDKPANYHPTMAAS